MTTPLSSIDHLAKAGYDAYCKSRSGKAYNGDALPQWDKVRTYIKDAWRAAAAAIVQLDGQMREVEKGG